MQIGDYRFEIVPDTEFWLDGGAMFGVVPRVLWERVTPPDELNRVRLNMNCAFVETASERILIETGIGEKWSDKETTMYGIDRKRPFAETLRDVTGCTLEDITIVVNTHLHFDHAGGNTNAEHGMRNAESGKLGDEVKIETDRLTAIDAIPQSAFRVPHSSVPQFPNARYFVSASEFEHAQNPHERDRASYLPENWLPLRDSGQLELKPDDYEVVSGLQITTMRGHSETMQTWKLTSGGETVYGFADLIPTRHHLPLAWIMGYDLMPAETLNFKKRILPEAVASNWMCLFYHDPDTPLCRLRDENGKVTAIAVEGSGSILR